MTRLHKSYLVNDPVEQGGEKNDKLPFFSYWIKKNGEEILMEQSYHLDHDIKTTHVHLTKLRNIIRKRKGFLRFYNKPVFDR